MSQGTVVEARDTPQVVTPALQSHSEEVPVTIEHAEVEASGSEFEREESLVTEQSSPSVLVEEKGEMQGGSQDTGKERHNIT